MIDTERLNRIGRVGLKIDRRFSERATSLSRRKTTSKSVIAFSYCLLLRMYNVMATNIVSRGFKAADIVSCYSATGAVE